MSRIHSGIQLYADHIPIYANYISNFMFILYFSKIDVKCNIKMYKVPKFCAVYSMRQLGREENWNMADQLGTMQNVVQAIQSSEPYQKAAEFIVQDCDKTLQQQLELVQIPAFSHHEEQKARRFQEMVEAEGYFAEMDDVCNVFTTIKGTGDGPTVMLTAHLDTVFPMDTPLVPRWEGTRVYCPGIADDTRGCAEVLNLLRTIRAAGLQPVGDIIIGANVGEEGLGDLKGMRHFFGKNPNLVDGYISLDGAGERYCFGAMGSYRYKVTFRGPGGHSNGDFGLVNPIHAMGRAIAYISEIRTPEHPKTTFSVGVVEGGTSVNAIAHECSMLVDLRSNGQPEQKKLDQEFRACIDRAVKDEDNRWEAERNWDKNSYGRHYDPNARIEVDLQQLGNRPAGKVPADHPFVNILDTVYRAVGITPNVIPYGSMDANIPLSMGIPGVGIFGGGARGNGHSLDEWYDPTDAHLGMQRTLLLLFAMVGLHGVSAPLLPKRIGKNDFDYVV